MKRISLSAALDAIALGFEVRTWTLLLLPPPPAGRGAREAGPGPGLRAHRGRGERSVLRQAGGRGRGRRRPPLLSWGSRRALGRGAVRCPPGGGALPPPWRSAGPWQHSAAAAAAPEAAADVAPFGCHPVAKASAALRLPGARDGGVGVCGEEERAHRRRPAARPHPPVGRAVRGVARGLGAGPSRASVPFSSPQRPPRFPQLSPPLPSAPSVPSPPSSRFPDGASPFL